MIKGDINEMVTSESLANENFIEVQKEDDKKEEDRPDENKV